MSLEVFLPTSFWLYGGAPMEATQTGRGGLDDSRPTSKVEFLLVRRGKGHFCIETFITDVAEWS